VTEDYVAEFRSHGKAVKLAFADGEDHIANVVRNTGMFYEAEMLADIEARTFFGKYAVDAGAHVGNHTIFMSAIMGMKTISFEPNPASFTQLKNNVELNGLENLCDLRAVGLGSKPGKASQIDGASGNSGMSSIAPDRKGSVKVTTLDQELKNLPSLDVLKIDVEGWECDVLSGGRKVIAEHKPLIYIEVSEATFPQVRSFLAELGYVCWKRFNATPTLLFLPEERLTSAAGKTPETSLR